MEPSRMIIPARPIMPSDEGFRNDLCVAFWTCDGGKNWYRQRDHLWAECLGPFSEINRHTGEQLDAESEVLARNRASSAVTFVVVGGVRRDVVNHG